MRVKPTLGTGFVTEQNGTNMQGVYEEEGKKEVGGGCGPAIASAGPVGTLEQKWSFSMVLCLANTAGPLHPP